MFTPEIQSLAKRSVLCWLASADADGQPNVSPKEIFTILDDQHLAIANIASPNSVRNLKENPKVCVSFIDVFVQKGFKVLGTARYIGKDELDYPQYVAPLSEMAGSRFTIHGVILVKATEVQAILAPSYRLYPDSTTEAAQVASAMRTYGVGPR